MKSPAKLRKIIGGIRKYAQLSPLYGKFKSENLEEIRARMGIPPVKPADS